MEQYVDIGCPDPKRAEYNRFIIANKLFTTAYLVVENYLTHTPQNEPLPSWMPRGELPTVGKKDWRQFGGGQAGIYKAEEPIVVEDLTGDKGEEYNENSEVKDGND